MENVEEFIIEQLRSGVEDAFKYIYKNHYAVLCHVASTYVNDDFIAESIVSDVIFHLWEIHETVEINTSLRSYLLKAVRNRSLDFVESKTIKSEFAFSSLSENEIVQGHYILSKEHPLDTLLEKELEERIEETIGHLPKDCRTVFEMSRFENKGYEEISNELNISVNTVKYHIKRAISQLREELGPYLTCLLFFLLN